MVRGVVTLPHGTENKYVLVLCTPDKEKEAKDLVQTMLDLTNLLIK